MNQVAEGIGARALSQRDRVDGSGITIAVIGSGVDPGHPDLQIPPRAGLLKIVDWADFSSEGLVITEAVASGRGWVDTSFGRLRTGGIRGRGGVLRVGMLRESSLSGDGAIKQDLNGNGLTTDIFPVLVVDSDKKGVFNRVYVDTNQDRDFTDEVPLGAYGQTHAFSRFRDKRGVNDAALHFVVAEVAQDGSRVRLGFDSLGSGTFLAGLVGAKGAAGNAIGIAPGASIMALKVLDSTGRCSWGSLGQAITYASKNGAQVILVDTGVTPVSDGHAQSLKELMAGVVDRYDVVILFPAGDGGPGLETCNAPTDSISALAIGGVNGSFEAPKIWARSAVGPTVAGGWAPDAIAPFAGASTAPTWLSRNGYALGAGTKVSAAYTAGCIALVLQACDRAGLKPEARDVMAALVEAGTPLESSQAIEQGGGLVNAVRTVDLLETGFRAPVPVIAEEIANFREGGLFARSFAPGATRFFVDNFSGDSFSIAFSDVPEWMNPWQERLLLPAVGERSVTFGYEDLEPGLHSAVVRGVEEGSGRLVTRFKQAVIRPDPLTPGTTLPLESRGLLRPGEYHRHFVQVTVGCTRLGISASNMSEEQAEVQVVGPGGRRAYIAELPGRSAWRNEIDLPEAGVWEIVVFREQGDQDISVSLAASADGFVVTPWPAKVDYQVAPPARTRLAFGLSNYWGDASIRIVPVTVSSGRDPFQPELIAIPRGHSFSRGFTVPDGANRLIVTVSHVSRREAGINVYLHSFDPQVGWKEVASSEMQGTSPEVIDIPNPVPGNYALYVESTDSATEVQCELTLDVLIDESDITWEGDGPVLVRLGEVLPVSLLVKDQEPPGSYQIQMQVVDARDNRLITCVPLMVVGTADAVWSAQVGGMAPGGKRYVTITVGHTAVVQESVVMVDGKAYALSDGSVTLALPAPGQVEVTLLANGKPLMARTLFIKDLPGGSAKTPEPSSDAEKDKLRNVLTTRMGL